MLSTARYTIKQKRFFPGLDLPSSSSSDTVDGGYTNKRRVYNPDALERILKRSSNSNNSGGESVNSGQYYKMLYRTLMENILSRSRPTLIGGGLGSKYVAYDYRLLQI